MFFVSRIASIFRAPDPKRDPVCQEHRAWMKGFEAREIPAHELVLEHARRVYEEFNRANDIIDAKAADVLRSSGLMVTIFVAAISALKLALTCFVVLALLFFLLSIAFALRARWILAQSGEPSARDVLEQGSELKLEVMKTWLAPSLHLAAEELRVVNHWKAERVREATCLLFVALLFVVAAALSPSKQPPDINSPSRVCRDRAVAVAVLPVTAGRTRDDRDPQGEVGVVLVETAEARLPGVYPGRAVAVAACLCPVHLASQTPSVRVSRSPAKIPHRRGLSQAAPGGERCGQVLLGRFRRAR